MVFVLGNRNNIERNVRVDYEFVEDLIRTENHATIISLDVDGMTGRTDDAPHQIEVIASVHHSSRMLKPAYIISPSQRRTIITPTTITLRLC